MGQKIFFQIVGSPQEEGQRWLCVASRSRSYTGPVSLNLKPPRQRPKRRSVETVSRRPWKLSNLEGRDSVHGTNNKNKTPTQNPNTNKTKQTNNAGRQSVDDLRCHLAEGMMCEFRPSRC